jgi:hypothetical protein
VTWTCGKEACRLGEIRNDKIGQKLDIVVTESLLVKPVEFAVELSDP